MSSPPEFPPLLAGVAAGMAHELNNQLAILMGRAELLQEEMAGQPALAEDLRVIREAAAHSHRAAQALVGLVRPRPRAPRPVSLAEAAHTATSMLAYTLCSGGVSCTLEADSNAPPVLADPDQLVRLLLGLLYLVQRAAREQGATPVSVAVRPLGGGAALSVQGPPSGYAPADVALLSGMAQDAGAVLTCTGAELCLQFPAA